MSRARAACFMGRGCARRCAGAGTSPSSRTRGVPPRWEREQRCSVPLNVGLAREQCMLVPDSSRRPRPGASLAPCVTWPASHPPSVVGVVCYGSGGRSHGCRPGTREYTAGGSGRRENKMSFADRGYCTYSLPSRRRASRRRGQWQGGERGETSVPFENSALLSLATSERAGSGKSS